MPLFLAGETANSYLRTDNDLQGSNIQNFMGVKKAILEKWMVAQKKHRLSDKHVQMGRELGLNPDKLGKIDNHKQETWKAPLPQFIEEIYYKRFKREAPETVKPLKQIMLEQEKKKKEQKKAKEERRKLRDENTDVSATDIIDGLRNSLLRNKSVKGCKKCMGYSNSSPHNSLSVGVCFNTRAIYP